MLLPRSATWSFRPHICLQTHSRPRCPDTQARKDFTFYTHACRHKSTCVQPEALAWLLARASATAGLHTSCIQKGSFAQGDHRHG